jgi:hypothetical protein
MATPEQILNVICPSFFETPDYEVYIDIANTMTAQEFFKENYQFAIALRAAHLWQLNTKRGDSAGPVTYRMEGRLAESYASPGVTRHELQLTKYGMQLYNLICRLNGTVSTTNVPVLERYGVI